MVVELGESTGFPVGDNYGVVQSVPHTRSSRPGAVVE